MGDMGWLTWLKEPKQWQPSEVDMQLANLLEDAPYGAGLYRVPEDCLREKYPWLAVIRMNHAEAS